MKMHQMATKIGGIVRGVFTDTIILEGKINKLKCNKNVIGGTRATAIKDFTKCINTTPKAPRFIEECPKPTKCLDARIGPTSRVSFGLDARRREQGKLTPRGAAS
jgi:hypothetical protein